MQPIRCQTGVGCMTDMPLLDRLHCARPQDPRAAQRAKRRRLLSEAVSARIRRGLIRYLEVVVDLSRSAALGDFRPTRASVVAGELHARQTSGTSTAAAASYE